MMRRSLMLVIAVGLATLGSSIAWSADSDQAALIKALDGAKLTLLQGIAQVAKGTEVPIEAKYQMVRGKLMLSIYTSAKGFDTAAEDNSFNEYIGDVTTANWTPKKDVFADLKGTSKNSSRQVAANLTGYRIRWSERVMGQKGFFDFERRLEVISGKGDPLQTIKKIVPWEDFRADIEAVTETKPEQRKSNAGQQSLLRNS